MLDFITHQSWSTDFLDGALEQLTAQQQVIYLVTAVKLLPTRCGGSLGDIQRLFPLTN